MPGGGLPVRSSVRIRCASGENEGGGGGRGVLQGVRPQPEQQLPPRADNGSYGRGGGEAAMQQHKQGSLGVGDEDGWQRPLLVHAGEGQQLGGPQVQDLLGLISMV